MLYLVNYASSHGLVLPVDALPCSGTKAPVKINVKASIMGEFKLPSNFKLVSGVYWISCSERFSKPVKVSIQHCCKLEQASSMCFVTTKCNQQEKSYTFVKMSEKSKFPIENRYATIEHFCGIAAHEE